MMRHLTFRCALLALVAAAPIAQAQGRATELGIDFFGAFLTSIDPDFGDNYTQTDIVIPYPHFRAGFFLSSIVSLEPAIHVSYRNLENVGSASFLSFAFGVPIHFTGDRARVQGFIRPALSWSFADDGTTEGQQFALGLGGGAKLPFHRHWAVRLEGVFSRNFESDEFFPSNTIGVLVGLSFLTN